VAQVFVVLPLSWQKESTSEKNILVGHYLSQVGWYALRMVGEIFGFGIRKKYGEALCCLPEAVWCNTVNPDRGFVLI